MHLVWNIIMINSWNFWQCEFHSTYMIRNSIRRLLVCYITPNRQSEKNNYPWFFTRFPSNPPSHTFWAIPRDQDIHAWPLRVALAWPQLVSLVWPSSDSLLVVDVPPERLLLFEALKNKHHPPSPILSSPTVASENNKQKWSNSKFMSAFGHFTTSFSPCGCWLTQCEWLLSLYPNRYAKRGNQGGKQVDQRRTYQVGGHCCSE